MTGARRLGRPADVKLRLPALPPAAMSALAWPLRWLLGTPSAGAVAPVNTDGATQMLLLRVGPWGPRPPQA